MTDDPAMHTPRPPRTARTAARRCRCGPPPSTTPAPSGRAGTCPPRWRTRARCCPPSPPPPSPATPPPATWSPTRCAASAPPWSRPPTSAATALGVEYEARWARLAAANIAYARRHGAAGNAEVIQGDARQLGGLLPPGTAGTAALIVTSPPYGPSIHGQVKAEARSGGGKVTKWDNTYGTDPANLASRRLDDLLDGLAEILTAARTLLRPGGIAVITTRPWRQRGELVDFPGAVLATGAAAGLIPVERCVALLAGLRGSTLVPRPSFFQLRNLREARARGKPWHLIAHEDVLIFRAPGKARGFRGTEGFPAGTRGPGVRRGAAGHPGSRRAGDGRMRLVQQLRRPRPGRRRAPAADRASRQPGRGAGERPCHAGRRVNRPRARPEPHTRAHPAPSAGIAARMPSRPRPGAPPGCRCARRHAGGVRRPAHAPVPAAPRRSPPAPAFTHAGRRGNPAGAGSAAVSTSTWSRAPTSAPCSCSSFRAPMAKAAVARTASGHRSRLRWSQPATWISDPATTACTCTRAAGPGQCSSAWLVPGAMRSRTSPPHARGLVRGRNKAVNSPPRLASATVTHSQAPPAGGRCPARDSTSTSSSATSSAGISHPGVSGSRSRAGAVRRSHHDQPPHVVPVGRRHPLR